MHPSRSSDLLGRRILAQPTSPEDEEYGHFQVQHCGTDKCCHIGSRPAWRRHPVRPPLNLRRKNHPSANSAMSASRREIRISWGSVRHLDHNRLSRDLVPLGLSSAHFRSRLVGAAIARPGDGHTIRIASHRRVLAAAVDRERQHEDRANTVSGRRGSSPVASKPSPTPSVRHPGTPRRARCANHRRADDSASEYQAPAAAPEPRPARGRVAAGPARPARDPFGRPRPHRDAPPPRRSPYAGRIRPPRSSRGPRYSALAGPWLAGREACCSIREPFARVARCKQR
jgi:hypothetical protein